MKAADSGSATADTMLLERNAGDKALTDDKQENLQNSAH